MVDDSIVRGTTSKEIIELAKEAGAKKVYMASASPPVRYPYVYGIDIPFKEGLIAHQLKTIDAIAKHIGADKLIYQDLSDLIDAVSEADNSPKSVLSKKIFDTSCFSGKYSTSDITVEIIEKHAQHRKRHQCINTQPSYPLNKPLIARS